MQRLLLTTCILGIGCLATMAQVDIDQMTVRDTNDMRGDILDFSSRIEKGIGIGIQKGFVIPHSPEVNNTKGASPVGFELSYSRLQHNQKSWDRCRCMPRSSFSLLYFDYNTPILGKGALVTYTIEPWYRIGHQKFLAFRVIAGLGYLNAPYDPLTNSGNRSYSIGMNGYLSVGINLWLPATRDWMIAPAVQYHHVSNRALRIPNEGINWFTAGLAMLLTERPAWRPYTRQRIDWRSIPRRWDIGIFGAAKGILEPFTQNENFGIAGFFIQTAKRIGAFNSFTLAADGALDQAAAGLIDFYGHDWKPWAASVMVGHEFILGRFLLGQQFGMYLHRPNPTYESFYHRWSLMYQINERWGTGISMLAHLQVAYATDVRVVWYL